MERPPFLAHLEAEAALEQVKASAVVVLPALVDEGVLLLSELEYGYEDLPLASDVAAALRGAFRAWHRVRGVKTDFRAGARAFAHAFNAGTGIAFQIRERVGERIRLDLEDLSNLGGEGMAVVPPPLQGWVAGLQEPLAAAFVSVQDKQLAVVAGAGKDEMLDDFLACACLWACLAGVEAGLERLEAG